MSYVPVFTHTLSWRVKLLGDSPVTCKTEDWGDCKMGHWRYISVHDIGEHEKWEEVVEYHLTSSLVQPLHVTDEVTWEVMWHGPDH